MMADLMFRKNDYEAATFHFQKLLEKKPGQLFQLFSAISIKLSIGEQLLSPLTIISISSVYHRFITIEAIFPPIY